MGRGAGHGLPKLNLLGWEFEVVALFKDRSASSGCGQGLQAVLGIGSACAASCVVVPRGVFADSKQGSEFLTYFLQMFLSYVNEVFVVIV